MQRKIFKRRSALLVVAAVFVLLSSCSPTKNLKEGEYFFTGYKIKSDNRSIDKDDYASYIRQKPNKKFFFLFRLQMGLYQLGTHGKDSSKFRKWLRTIGEEPVILDTVLTHRSTNQLHILMNKKGYFNALVTDSVIYNKKRAEVVYTIRSDVPYKIKSINYTSEDTAIYRQLVEQQRHSLIQPGMNYDENLIDFERDRFVTEMKALGYYFFTKQFITFTADTSLASHSVNLTMNVARLNELNVSPADNIRPENHHQYFLNKIFIQTDYEPMATSFSPPDTSFYKNYFFLFASDTSMLRFRRDFLLNKIFISSGDLFNINDVKNTYSRLTDLNVFRFVNMKFEEVPRDSAQQSYLLDVFILLSPLPNQDFTIETEVTNNAGNRGAAVNIVYRNKNIFKGAEQLELKVKSGAELQKTFSESENKNVFVFNTFEIGPEINLNLKKLILLNQILRKAERQWNPRTKISMSANYQERPDYTRSIANFLFSENFKTTPRHRWTFDWFDWSAVSVLLSQSFTDKLEAINDKGLTYSYNDHLITSGRLSWLYSNQKNQADPNFDFVQANLESSGNLLWIGSRIKGIALFENDSTPGIKKIFGTTFSQNVRLEFDFRHYQNFITNNTLVYRFYAGIGKPYGNSISLPFEKSFYGGGSNDIRAWQFRTLGPGSYSNPIDIEQTGEFKLEGNAELRSVLMKYVEGAVFADAGNVWLLNKDAQRPGGDFDTNRFLSEIAFGGGIGIRFNFTYFILRLDGAVKLIDPSRIESERWVYGTQKFSAKDVNYNVGIGYPF